MRVSKWLLIPLFATGIAFAQNPSSSPTDLPKLNHFDATIVDRNLDPCDNFYKFVCSKWAAANPIPSDQPVWTTGSALKIGNQSILRDAME